MPWLAIAVSGRAHFCSVIVYVNCYKSSDVSPRLRRYCSLREWDRQGGTQRFFPFIEMFNCDASIANRRLCCQGLPLWRGTEPTNNRTSHWTSRGSGSWVLECRMLNRELKTEYALIWALDEGMNLVWVSNRKTTRRRSREVRNKEKQRQKEKWVRREVETRYWKRLQVYSNAAGIQR